MTEKAKGYPHKQDFNVSPRPNKKRNAWYRAGRSRTVTPTKKQED